MSADIADGTITSTDINDNTIAAADIGTGAVTTDEILDNTIAAIDINTGAVTTDEILDGTILGDDIASSTITTTHILDNTILSADIADGTITSTDIFDGTIAGADIGTGVITSTHVLDNTLTANDIGAGAVTTSEILDNTITSADIATGSVTTDEILDGTIIGDDIANDEITTSHILDNTITANDIGVGAVATSEILDNTITANDIGPNAVGMSEMADDAVGPNEIDVSLNYPWTGLHTFGDGTGAHKYTFYSNVPPAGNDATLLAQNADPTGLAFKALGNVNVSATLTANTLALTNPLTAGNISIDASTIVNNAGTLKVGTVGPTNMSLTSNYAWTGTHSFTDANNAQFIVYSNVPVSGNNATIYARNDAANGFGIYTNAKAKIAKNLQVGDNTLNSTSVTAYNNSATQTIDVVNYSAAGKAMKLTNAGDYSLHIDRTDGDVTTEALYIENGGLSVMNGVILNASTFNDGDGLGMVALLNMGSGEAMYANSNSTLKPTVVLENSDATSASKALKIANGGVVLKSAVATGTADLSNYGYASVIQINQDITTPPAGEDGQILYIYNSDGSDHTFNGMNVKAGKVSTFIYIGAWRQVDDPS